MEKRIVHEASTSKADDGSLPKRVDQPAKKRIRLSPFLLNQPGTALSSWGLKILPKSRCLPQVEKRGTKRKSATPIDANTPKKSKLTVADATHLTPNAKAFYKCARQLQNVASKFQHVSAKKKLKFLSRPNKLQMLDYLRNVNDTTMDFFLSRHRTQKSKPMTTRFNTDDKIFALSLYKQSGRAYRYLSKIFSLPSRKTLISLLDKIPFGCGINKSIFEHLKTNVTQMKRRSDKFCVLMFDEIALKPSLHYNERADMVEGLVDDGVERRASFADHALVFLLKGIRRKWKQPVCFTFCEDTTPADLVRILKDVIREVRTAGFSLVATICDQGATNRAAIDTLLLETNEYCVQNNIENCYQGYLVDGEEIVHLYDFPHLLEGIRNDMLTKELHFTEEGTEKVASWSHIERVYKTDKRQSPRHQFYKLTDEHVMPEKIRKVKVQNCTQVLSHIVASVMYISAKCSLELPKDSDRYLDPKAVDTAALLLFFDKLFDSVNGAALHPPIGKPFRSVVTRTSDHISLWKSSIPVLKSMYYVTSGDPRRKFVSVSIKNWIFSLHSMIYISERLLRRGLKYLAPRCFNQDPLDNFFSCIRSHGLKNTKPTCSSFLSSFKSLLINNFVSPHSDDANCEEDESEGALDTLRRFIEKQKDVSECGPPVVHPQPTFPPFGNVKSCFVNDYASAHVARFVAKKVLGDFTCDLCLRKLCARNAIPQDLLLREGEYSGSDLNHPSSKFTFVFKKATKVLLNHIPQVITAYGIKNKLNVLLRGNCLSDISSLFCDCHNNVDMFISTVIDVVFYLYLNNINNILSGKDLRRAYQDPLTSLAFAKYLQIRRAVLQSKV